MRGLILQKVSSKVQKNMNVYQEDTHMFILFIYYSYYSYYSDIILTLDFQCQLIVQQTHFEVGTEVNYSATQ